MARIARITVPGIPHHVIQRGNRRQPVFFKTQDHYLYLKLLKKMGEKYGLNFWAYCLMENHVHLIVVPENEESLGRGLGEVHRCYTSIVNEREGWRGYLWQGRFLSFPLDEPHLYNAIRYVELNPVRAGIVKKAEHYPWSSAKAHVFGTPDPVISLNSLKDQIGDWAKYLSISEESTFGAALEKHARTGRPFGSEDFINRVEILTGRPLGYCKRGRKPIYKGDVN